MKGVTILIIPTQVGPTLYAYLLGRSPNHAQWLENACFAEISEEAVNPIVVSDQQLTGSELIAYVASLLFAEDRTRPIHMTREDYYFVFASPEYQLYLANFETLEELQVAYKALFQVDLIAVDLEAGKVKARADVKAYFLG